MSYTGEDGRIAHFRLMHRLKPHWREVAIALKFAEYEIAVMEKKDDQVFYLLSEWLRGANQEDSRLPVTWRTVIIALRHAHVLEEASILETYIVEIPVTAQNSGEYKIIVLHIYYVGYMMNTIIIVNVGLTLA